MNDIILNNNLELQIEDGDLVIANSTSQHQKLIVLSEKNDFKEFPLVGVGPSKFIESERRDAFIREIKQQFIKDGMQVSSVKFEGTKLLIEADYES